MTTTRTAIAGLLLAVLMAAPAGLWAQTTSADAQKRIDRGLAHYKRGIALRKADNEEAARAAFAAAAKEFEPAYAIDGKRETLYAWAQAERQAGNCQPAIGLYQKLLDSKPESADQIKAARQSIAICEAALSKRRDEEAESAAILPPDAQDGNLDVVSRNDSFGRRLFRSPTRLVLLAVGVAGLGASAGFFVRSNANKNFAATRSDRWSESIDRANTKRLISGISLGVGVGLIVTSFVLDEGASLERGPISGMNVQLGRDHAAVTWGAEF